MDAILSTRVRSTMNDKAGTPADGDSPTFMRPVPTRAGALLWMLAGVSALALVGLQFLVANSAGAARPGNLAGRVVGAIVFPLLVSWLASRSGHASSQRAKVQVFTATSLVLLALGASTVLAVASRH